MATHLPNVMFLTSTVPLSVSAPSGPPSSTSSIVSSTTWSYSGTTMGLPRLLSPRLSVGIRGTTVDSDRWISTLSLSLLPLELDDDFEYLGDAHTLPNGLRPAPSPSVSVSVTRSRSSPSSTLVTAVTLCSRLNSTTRSSSPSSPSPPANRSVFLSDPGVAGADRHWFHRSSELSSSSSAPAELGVEYDVRDLSAGRTSSPDFLRIIGDGRIGADAEDAPMCEWWRPWWASECCGLAGGMSTRSDGEPARWSAARDDDDSRRTVGEGSGGEGEDGNGTEVEGPSTGEATRAAWELDDDATELGTSAGVGGGVVSSSDTVACEGESPTERPSELSASAGVPRRGGLTAGLLSRLPRRGNTIAGAGDEDGDPNDVLDPDDARRGTVGIGPDAGVDHVGGEDEDPDGAAERSMWWACWGER